MSKTAASTTAKKEDAQKKLKEEIKKLTEQLLPKELQGYKFDVERFRDIEKDEALLQALFSLVEGLKKGVIICEPVLLKDAVPLEPKSVIENYYKVLTNLYQTRPDVAEMLKNGQIRIVLVTLWNGPLLTGLMIPQLGIILRGVGKRSEFRKMELILVP